jgi:hypothetical protein
MHEVRHSRNTIRIYGQRSATFVDSRMCLIPNESVDWKTVQGAEMTAETNLEPAIIRDARPGPAAKPRPMLDRLVFAGQRPSQKTCKLAILLDKSGLRIGMLGVSWAYSWA